MKRIIITALLIAGLLFILSIPADAQIKLRVTSVVRTGNQSEVIARSNRYWYRAVCQNLPDSVKQGTILQAESFKGQENCICLFKRR